MKKQALFFVLALFVLLIAGGVMTAQAADGDEPLYYQRVSRSRLQPSGDLEDQLEMELADSFTLRFLSQSVKEEDYPTQIAYEEAVNALDSMEVDIDDIVYCMGISAPSLQFI